MRRASADRRAKSATVLAGRCVLGVVVAFAFLGTRAVAQSGPATEPTPDTVHAVAIPSGTIIGGLEAWGGVANGSPQWGLLGEAPGMNLGLLAVRWSRALGAPPGAGALPALEWTVDFIPFARISPPLVSLRGTGVPCGASLCVLKPDPSTRVGYFPPGSPMGLGIAPLGITRHFLRGPRVSAFAGAAGGMLWFTERVPTTKASQFNFTASAELGVRFGSPSEPGLTVRYRFHHLSNAGTAGENPGLASHMITVGIHRPRLRHGTSPARP